MSKIKKGGTGLLQTLFFLIFSMCFTFIGVGVLFNQTWYEYTAPLLAVFCAVFLGIICIAYRLINRHASFLEGKYPVILALFALFMLTAQLIFGNMLRFDPIYDMEAIYKGAIQWVETGTFANYRSDTCYADYFYIFKNNLGAMALLALLFKLCAVVGISDYFFAATVLNALLCVGAICLTSLVCKRLFGIQKGILALFICLIFPPFYFCAAVFYTDFLTVIFPILSFYLYLEGSRKKRDKDRAVLFAASCLVAAVGILIKFTVIIVIIALLLALLLHKQWKNAHVYALCALIMIGGSQVIFNAVIYPYHLDRQTAAEKNTPYSHWIMMGLAGDGDYESEDFWTTRSYNNQAERKAAINAEIKSRLGKLGIVGLADLMAEKAVRCFGDGTCNLTDFLDDNPQKSTFLNGYLIAGGSHHFTYRHLCTGIYLAVFTLMLFGAFGALMGKRKEKKLLVPLLCIFGIMLFLLIWEVNSRYIVNFLPMMFVCAAGGIDFFVSTIKKAAGKIKGQLG